MIKRTLHIDKPSKQLLELVRSMRKQKEENRNRFASMKDVYFPIKED